MRKVLLTAASCALTTLALAPAALAQDDLNCDDFDSQAEAQATLDANPSDPNNLDADDDMQACEDSGLPAGTSSMSTSATPSVLPSASSTASTTASSSVSASTSASASPTAFATVSVAASPSALPGTGGITSPLAILSFAILIGGGILAAGIVRRR